jgi:uncharacterized membrane protein YbhN (UPF0104 family)
MMYFCLFAMDATAHLDFTACLTVFAIGTIGVVIPAPGAGAGTYHFAVMQALLLFNVPEADGIAYATMVHGLQMILFLLVGAIASLVVLAKGKSNPHHRIAGGAGQRKIKSASCITHKRFTPKYMTAKAW